MKKFLLIVAVAAVAMLADTRLVEAGRRGGCGGGGGCGGYGGGCGMGYGGGCGMGGCGMGYGGFAMGGCGMGGCGMGYGGMMMGGCGMGGCGMGYGGGIGCAGGICQLNTLGGAVITATGNEATLVVNLPEDATLTIDNEATTSLSSQRVFITPALESGKEYQYTLTAQIIRDGKVQTLTEQVTVRPGEVSRVELTAPAAGVAAQ